MRILQVSNKYQNPGGEDVVVEDEYKTLTKHGHEVHQWIVHNSVLNEVGTAGKLKIALKSIWSPESQKQIAKLIGEFKPDVVHVHNTMPLISASIYQACHRENVAVVQTLHNYRFVCPGSPLYRDGHVCEDCLGKLIPYPGALHGCYRNSRVDSTFTVANLTFNRLRGTYKNDIDLYIALTEFARQKFIQGGLPAHKFFVKPNFITSEMRPGSHQGGYALFVGRLVEYKGINTLIDAWKLLKAPIPLKIVGQGPMESEIRSEAPETVSLLGQVTRDEVFRLMQDATMLIFPSKCYETFGMTLIEAMSTGLPVIASRNGGSPEIIQEGGWLFNPGDPVDLARVVEEALSNPDELSKRGQQGLKICQEKYTVEVNYHLIMKAYQTAIDNFHNGSRSFEPEKGMKVE